MQVVLLVIVALVAYLIFVQVQARKQIDVEVGGGKLAVQQVVDQVFGSILWSRVGGPGHINLKPKLRARAPTISIDVEPTPGGGCLVQIWMSAWTTRYGLVHHAQLAWRKKRALAGRLRTSVGTAPGASSTLHGGAPTAPPSAPWTPPTVSSPGAPAATQRPPSPTAPSPPSSPRSQPAPPPTAAAGPRAAPAGRPAIGLTPGQQLALRLLRESPLTVVGQTSGDVRQLLAVVRNAVGVVAPGSATHFVLGPPRATMWAQAFDLPRGGSMVMASVLPGGNADLDFVRSLLEEPLRRSIESQGGNVRIYSTGQHDARLESVINGARVVPVAELVEPS